MRPIRSNKLARPFHIKENVRVRVSMYRQGWFRVVAYSIGFWREEFKRVADMALLFGLFQLVSYLHGVTDIQKDGKR